MTVNKIYMTTSNTFQGFNIIEYISVESVEVVLGSGFSSELNAGLADLLGGRSSKFEKKLHDAKEIAFHDLKSIAISKKANAIIGIDIDYTEFSNNMMGVIVTGTIVKIKKDFKNEEDEILDSI